jgi:hypothetical protein
MQRIAMSAAREVSLLQFNEAGCRQPNWRDGNAWKEDLLGRRCRRTSKDILSEMQESREVAMMNDELGTKNK